MEKYKIISYKQEDNKFEFVLYCNIHKFQYNVIGDYKYCKCILSSNSCGCPMCNPSKKEAKLIRNQHKLNLLTKYDLLSMDWAVILDLIGEDKLPNEFKCLTKFGENTPGRKKMIEDLKETYNIETSEEDEETTEIENVIEESIETEVDNIDLDECSEENELNPLKEIKDIGSILNDEDNEIFSTGDKWLHIIHKQMNKIWNLILRDNENHSTKNIDIIKSKLTENITKFEKYVYEEFLKEYEEVINLEIH